jgi:phenylpropionate dioxygenase-like ring-hydroxylating dioxygenase large terminal subunit
MTKYLRNCWYAFGWVNELGAGVLARTVLGQKIVAFRQADGTPVALQDRCPHRFAPLSRGEAKNGALHCAYHGLAFAGDGACVHYPFGDVPANARVRAFPLAERDGMIWIWPGEAALADASKIPDFSFHQPKSDDDWVITGYTHMKTEYQVETDNLLDLSHIETIHRGTFGGRGYVNTGKLELRDLGEEIHANWWMPGIPLYDRVTGAPNGMKADHFLDMRWNAPCAMRLQISFMPEGHFAGREMTLREDLPGHFQAHILTPETETTTHYFWSANKATDMNAGVPKEGARALMLQAFEKEDKVLLEAVQANMEGEFWSCRPMILPADAGGIRARRRLAKMITDEKQNAAPPITKAEIYPA